MTKQQPRPKGMACLAGWNSNRPRPDWCCNLMPCAHLRGAGGTQSPLRHAPQRPDAAQGVPA